MLRALFAEVFVVADDPAPFAPFDVQVVGDLVPGKGAPGGVYTAVTSASAPWVFCVGCDMPFLEREAIELLAARRGEAAAAGGAGDLAQLPAAGLGAKLRVADRVDQQTRGGWDRVAALRTGVFGRGLWRWICGHDVLP